jgi:hypothetical protein
VYTGGHIISEIYIGRCDTAGEKFVVSVKDAADKMLSLSMTLVVINDNNIRMLTH